MENSTKLKKFYFNNTLNEFRPCYETCATCDKEGNAKYHNCLTCETNHMFRPDGSPKNNCVAYCKYYYISSYGQYKCLDKLKCPEDAKLLIKEKNECIDDCTKDNTYKYQYNGNCLKSCPEQTQNISFICQEIDVNKCSLGIIDSDINDSGDLGIIGTLVKSFKNEFSYTNNHISQFKNNEYNIIVYKNTNCITELSLAMPKVDFQNCYNEVKNHYKIEDDLIIVIADKLNNKNPSTSFSFFNPLTGEKLDAETICKDETIIVEENLLSFLNENDTNYKLMIYLTDQNINIFNISDAFYTDLCFDYDNPLKKDIPLKDRVATFYPNVTLCDEGCETKGINVENMTSICDCKFVDIANNNLIKDNVLLSSLVGEFLDIIENSNILVVKCYKYIFKYFSRSIGGFLIIIFILIHIALTLMFFIKELPSIQKYVYELTENFLELLSKSGGKKINSSPPKKLKEIKSKRNKLKNDIKKNVKANHSDKDNIKIKKKNTINKTMFTSETQEKLKVEKNKHKNKNILLNISKFKSNSKENLLTFNLSKKSKFNNNSKYFNKNKEINFSIENNEKLEKNEKFFNEYLTTEIDDMDFEDIIVKDERKFCEFFVDTLKEEQIIANTFISSDPLKTRAMKIIIFTLNIILYFVVNGLFFSENYISEVYNLEGEEGFFDFFPRSIDRFFYTTMVSIIATFIVDFFFIEEKKIKRIFKREKDNESEIKYQIIEIIRTLKISYISFIGIVFAILLISFYYLLCFNYVYPHTQVEWIKSSIVIMIIMQIISILQCLLEAILRFISFSCKSEKIFRISKLVN